MEKKRIKTQLLFMLIYLVLCYPMMLQAAGLNFIYQGENTVDMRINNDISEEWKKFDLKRDNTPLKSWMTQTDEDIYYSDSVSAFSNHTYTLLSYWGTNGIHWFGHGTDINNADTSIISGTIHNSLNWQLILDRNQICWSNHTDGYTVSNVNVPDGDLGIYNTTIRMNNASDFLKAISPGTITAYGTTFTSTTDGVIGIKFENQSDLAVEPINQCSFHKINLNINNCDGVEIKDTVFTECLVTTDSTSSGTIFNNCTGDYDLTIGGDRETVQNCKGINQLYISGTNHDILRNQVRNMEARGDFCTIQDNIFNSSAYNWIRLDLYGNSSHVLENTLDHREADDGYPMIRVLGEDNIVEKNVITEYVGGAGAWGNGIDIQGGNNNTVQLNNIIGYISGYTTNNHGIILDGATGNLVKKNTVKNCQNGIWLGFPNPAENNNIENNAISSTTRAAIDIEDRSNSNVIAYNHIWTGSTGIYVSGDGNGIHENIISDCTYRGIYLLAEATNSWVYNNVFRNNSAHAKDDGTGNIWNKPKTAVNRNIVGGPFLGGNYWDTYTGPDINNDKLGDTPYPISGSAAVSDGLPLIYVSMPSPTPASTPFETNAVVSGDYTGDGTADPAIFRESNGLWAVRGVTRIYFGTTNDIPVSGDYNGDGSSDIAIFRTSSGLWAVRSVTRVYFGCVSDYPAGGDYNGDGTCDLGIFRENSGLWAIRGLTRVYYGSEHDIPVSDDYNNNGKVDIAIYRADSGLWAVRSITRIYFGNGDDLPVAGDYNATGSRKPAIFRDSSGLWAVRGVTRLYFGASNDKPVPADFNGNGDDDFGIFRRNSGLWAIRGITRLYFGAVADCPVTR